VGLCSRFIPPPEGGVPHPCEGGRTQKIAPLALEQTTDNVAIFESVHGHVGCYMTGLMRVMVCLAAVLGLGCGDGVADAIVQAIGGECVLDSDCEDGLACAFQVCHQRCETSKDCPAGDGGEHLACVTGPAPAEARICQLSADVACELHSDCADPLECAMDNRCRNQCDGDRDCVPGQLCISASCADESELVDGRLVLAASAEGKPCTFSSDCGADGTWVCREAVCGAACFGSDRDCGRYQRCSSADPLEAGSCEPIGDAALFVCSPHAEEPDSEVDCACPGGTSGTQLCKQDGSGYEPCTREGTPCLAP